ncbi:MAG: CU044_2847 family protein [Chloroflexales bacterium]
MRPTSQVSLGDDLDAVMTTIAAVANRLHQSLARLKPQKVPTKFGTDLGAESSQLAALIVKGSGTTNLTD